PNAVPGVPLGADEANAVRRAKATLQRSGSSVRVRTKWQISRVASSWADTTGRQRSCGSLRSQGRRGPCSASFASLRSAHSATQGPPRPRLRLPAPPPGEERRLPTRSNLLWQFARPEHGVHLTLVSAEERPAHDDIGVLFALNPFTERRGFGRLPRFVRLPSRQILTRGRR